MRKFLLSLTILSCVLALYICCGTETAGGGSGTETVGGVFVDSLGNPVFNAVVNIDTVTSDTASSMFVDYTDKQGRYHITGIKSGVYTLSGHTQDSSLVLNPDTIVYADDNDSLFLGIDTMHAPGFISGRVLCDSVAIAGVQAWIPGTSFSAWCDDSGDFTISNIRPGTYTVSYKYDGYITSADSGVQVYSGIITTLDTKYLKVDFSGPPPAPSFVNGAYDTASGVVLLSWQKITTPDLMCYYVFRKLTAETGGPVSFDTVFTNVCHDTVFTDFMDTSSYRYTYQVKAVDSLWNESKNSPAAEVYAVSPTIVRTFVKWTQIPDQNDTIVSGDTVRLAISFTNKSRKNILLRWLINSPSDTARIVVLDTKTGVDTLLYVWQDTGAHTVCVSFLDEKGSVWSSECVVTVEGIVPVDHWEQFHPLNNQRRFSTAAVMDSTIYVTGGAQDLFFGDKWKQNALASMESFTFGTQTQAWSSLPSMPTARYFAAMLAVESKLYIIGGMKFEQEYDSIEVYNTQTGTWEGSSAMPQVRIGHAACVYNHEIYIFGGLTKTLGGDYIISSDIDKFDPATRLWTTIDSMSVPRANHQVVLLDDKAYILGGYSDPSYPVATASVEIYDLSTGMTTRAGDMIDKRMNFGAAAINGKIYVAGGLVSDMTNEILDNVEMFDPLKNSWTPRKPLLSARYGCAACGYNNCMYIIGGSESTVESVLELKSVLRYYP